MYIPRNSLLNLERNSAANPSSRRRRHSPHRGKFSMAAAAILLVALLLAAALLQKSGPESEPLSAKPLLQDMDQLWEWNEQLLAGGSEEADWSVRWDGILTGDQSLTGLSRELFADAEGKSTDKQVSQGGKSIAGSYPGDWGGRLALHETERTAKGTAVVVLLENEDGAVSRAQLREAVQTIAAVLAQHTSEAKATIKSHGYSRMPGAGSELARIAMGRVLEQYEDGDTRSVTLSTDKLLAEQPLDKYRYANLQLSEHRNTENGRTELTIGIPLLTGEFGKAEAAR
ncbi:MAG: TATA-box binding protein [Paenibacillus sp.]|nr:TATA-box binding protein [Paenibacillus sp.]